ncbi:MAG: hypothetical protein ACRBG0_22720 [Lewinella sp.]|jgi:hypothetical protein|uniref:hypothetical protein n=1 Tax=Lewinella sp. TaxID=2004506 RepID=UPI003D6BA616
MRSIDVIRLALIGGVVLLSLLFLIRVLPVVRFLLIIILVVLLAMVLVYFFTNTLKEKKAQKAYEGTTAGQITGKITDCEGQLSRLKEERANIEKSLRDLKQKLRGAAKLNAGIKSQTEHLVQGFEQELQLRNTKIVFYEQCLQKLNTLLKQHELLTALEEKKAELDKYREKHYDELAKMENLRWEVERETVSLETIQDLSTRMQRSEQLDDVLHLQKELEKMLAP